MCVGKISNERYAKYGRRQGDVNTSRRPTSAGPEQPRTTRQIRPCAGRGSALSRSCYGRKLTIWNTHVSIAPRVT